MQIPPLLQNILNPPPPPKYNPRYATEKGPVMIYALNLTEKDLQIFMCRIWPKRRGWDFFAWDWDFSGCSWYLVWVVEIISVMVKIFLGEKIKKFSERLRFFGKCSNYFWSGWDVFGNGLDFFVWLRFLRDGLRIEFFSGNWKFFHVNWNLFFREWDVRYFQSN